MSIDHPRSAASIGGHPIHGMLVHFPIALFFAVFVTDLIYWRTALMTWETFSIWLLTAGLVMDGVAGAFGLIDFVASPAVRRIPAAWLHLLCNGAIFILALVNAFVHSRDGYTSVVPTGLILSGLVVLLLMVTGWLGGQLVYRHGVGVAR